MDQQPTSLICPTCGAPLEFDGTHAVVRCKFCGNTSFLPGVLSGQASAPATAIEDLRKLAGSGNVNEAIEKFSQMYGGDPQEAKHAIDAIQAGRLATPSTAGMRAPEELTRALQEVQHRLSAGDKIGAIKIYREHFDVSLARAKYAIEQIQAGQTLQPEADFPSATSSASTSSTSYGSSSSSRSGRAVIAIVVTCVVLFVGAMIALPLFLSGGTFNPRYITQGPAILIPSEESAKPDFAVGLFYPDKDTRFLGLVDGTKGKLSWHAPDLPADGYLDAIASGPDLFYAASGANLMAYHKTDGSLAWQAQMTDKLNYGSSSLLVTAGRIITTNTDESIQAYDAETGTQVWSRRLNGYDSTLRLVGASLVVIDYTDNASDYGLIFLDPVTGTQQKLLTPSCTHDNYPFHPGPSSGFIYDQSGNALYLVYTAGYGCVQKLDLASGQPVWETDSQDNFNFSGEDFQYLMTDSTIYFANGNDVLAVDKNSGSMHVLITNPDYSLLPLAVSGDNLIVRARRTRGTERFELWAVGPSSNLVWQVDLQDSSPIDPPNEMAGLIDKTGTGWTWKLVPTGLVVITFQAQPNQVVLETFDTGNGTSLGKQAVKLSKITDDFYEVPTVIAHKDNVLYFELETNIYSLDVATGQLTSLF